jgi:cysteine desulfurase family protein (TIGR01976 family)
MGACDPNETRQGLSEMNYSDRLLPVLRDQFPALSRQCDGQPVAYFDGPAGTQVPLGVIDAIAGYLRYNNANHGGLFATSHDSDRMLDAAHRTVADLLGTDDPETAVFGPNMTTLTFALSRALARTWQPGDQVLVTRLDHDANVTPWVLAARDAGAEVTFVEIHREDCTLDLDDFHAKLTDRTRLVAVGCASNSVGTINPVAEICRAAHEVGALTFLDAVHFAPHALIDVVAWDCDFLACSAYKFFGPHIGILWGRRELLEELPAYKVRPAPDSPPGKWMTGTQNHECIAGVAAAIDYLADLGRAHADDPQLTPREALRETFRAIGDYERQLSELLLSGLTAISDVRIWGITARDQLNDRVPTVSITHRRLRPAELAARLGELGLFTWHGNYYALQLTETLGLEPDGMLRIGLVHYNTVQEVQRLLTAIEQLSRR